MNQIQWEPLNSVSKTKGGFPPFQTWIARVIGGYLYATTVLPKTPEDDSEPPVVGVTTALVFVPDLPPSRNA